MALELDKESIEYEQLLGENTIDTVVKAEYVIPDTHPDVSEILMLDAKPSILTSEVMQDKVYLEGQVEYNVLYLANEEGKNTIYSANYTGKFANYAEIPGAAHGMGCENECYVEHMECTIVNERKISVEGIIKLKAEVFKNYNIEIIKDIKNSNDIQLLKNPASIDKIVGSIEGELKGKSHIQISMDKPQIESILECSANVHKRDVKILDNKLQIQAFVLIGVLYKEKDTGELQYVMDDVMVNEEIDNDGINPSMTSSTDFRIDSINCDIKQDDLGESRIIDVEVPIKTNTKVMSKEDIDMIEDAYSPDIMINMEKKDYELNVLHGASTAQAIIKENIDIPLEAPKPSNVIMCLARACITDKKIVEDKVLVDGIVNVDVLYKTSDENKPVYKVSDELPFSCVVEIPGCKIDMSCVAKVFLDSVDAAVEANTIAIKAIVMVYSKVSYMCHKEFLVNMEPVEGEVPKKKASITIYVVQQGDTIWKIAKQFYTTMDSIIKLNNIENPDSITPGQKFIIPGRALIS